MTGKDVIACWMKVVKGLVKSRTQQGGKMLHLNNMMDHLSCLFG